MTNRDKKMGFRQKLSSFVKKVDSFGTPVSLTYKQDPQIKSFLGGVFTIIARLGVVIYLLIQCLKVINKESVIQTSILQRDLTTDGTEKSLTLDNFDYGVRLEYIFFETQPEIQENLDQYVYLQISQNVYTWVKDSQGVSVFAKEKTKTQLGNCNNGRLGLTSGSEDFLALKAGYKCPEKVDYKMKGSFSGEQTKFVQVRVGYCNQTYLDETYNKTKKCKSTSEILQVAGNLKLYFVVQNSYFDTSDYSGNPIKTFLKPYYLPTKNYTSIYYYMALSSNTAKFNDNALYGSPTTKEFIQTRVDYPVIQEIPTSESTPNAFIAVYIQMDDTYKIVTRTVTTYIDALQTTGGFMTVIVVVISVIISNFQKTIYTTSLIKSFYKYQKHQRQGQEESLFSKDDEDDERQKSQIALNYERMNTDFDSLDKFQQKKALIYNRIVSQINDRKKLVISLSNNLITSLRRLCCRKQSSKEVYKQVLYKRGQLKLQKELDIRYIAKQLKTLKFLSKVIMTKYQRHLIQYFKENLLNNKNEKQYKISKKDETKLLCKYLLKTVENCNTEKMDARILKNVDYSEDDQIVEEMTKIIDKKNKNDSIDKSYKKKRSSANTAKNDLSTSTRLKQITSDFTDIDEMLRSQQKKSSYFVNEEEFKDEVESVTTNRIIMVNETGVNKFKRNKQQRNSQFSNTMTSGISKRNNSKSNAKSNNELLQNVSKSSKVNSARSKNANNNTNNKTMDISKLTSFA